MSAQHNAPSVNSAFAVSRQNALAAAVAPLLEGLETRSHFSATPTANPGGPYSVNEGQNITITGLGSSDSDGNVASYQWDTNYDANKGFKNRVTTRTWKFIADSSGSRTIALRVTDNNGDVSGIQTATINIADVAPTLTFTAPNTATEAEAVNVSWSYSDPSAADVVTAWSVAWGDGSTSTYAGSTTGSSHTYTEDGNYTMTLTATQADGPTSVTHNIAVVNNPPVVIATTPHDTIDEGENVQLDFSSPNRATTLDGWQIDWGDGQVEVMEPTRSHAVHFYTDSGNYTAVVTAQEPDGGNGAANVNFTVRNVAADVAITSVPTTGTEGTAITLGSTVTDAGQDDTHTYGWTVYRNNTQFQLPNGTNITGQSFTFTPTDNGSYVVRLSVLDDEGAIKTVNSDPIVVANVAPTATITGTPQSAINEGAAVSLLAVPADAGSEDTFTYAWSVTKGGVAYALPNGTNVNSAAFNFTPADNGVYVASVIVTDDDLGSVTVASSSFSVNNVAPTASITAPTTGNEGTAVNATSTVVDPGTADQQTYAWTVEKLTGGGNGTYTTDLYSGGEVGNLDWGTNFTVTSRVKADSAMANGASYLLLSPYGGSVALQIEKFGNDISVRLVDGSNHYVSTPSNAAVADTFFDLAVTYNGSTGATEIFIDGVSAATGTLDTNIGGMQHTHFAEQFQGTVDSLGLYHTELAAPDIADLHNDVAITTTPTEYWEFGDAVNSATAVGNNGHDIMVGGGTFSGSSMFVPYALPSNAVTNEANFAFVPTDNGTYRLKLTVTDDDTGTVNTTSSDIVVANVAPTAEITGDSEGVEGTALNFNVAADDAGTADTHTYLWSVRNNNANYNLYGAAVNGTAFSFVPVNNGSYEVKVVVTDNDGGTVTKTVTVEVANADPVVTITGAPTTSTEGQAISLGSTASDAGTADATHYQWSVTKGTAAYDLTGVTTTNSSFAFTPDDNGTYVVTLVATDDDGGTATISTAAIVVANVDPTGVITGEPIAPLVEGAQADLLVTASDDGVNDDFEYAWTIKKDGDDWTPLDGTTLDDAALSFVPTDDGSYVATVVITDNDGGEVSVDSQPILVVNANPTATITGAPNSGTEGTAINLGSTVHDDGVVDTFTYAWSVTKDNVAVDLTGINHTSETFAFTPSDNGAYVFTLVVTDNDYGTTTTSASLTVNNADPVPTISGDSSVNEAQAITLTAAANDPGSIDTHTYLWSVTKNSVNYTTGLGATNAASFTFTPNLFGTYEVSCVVTDNNGGHATATKTITANNVAPTATITGVPTGVRGEGSPIALSGAGSDVAAETGLTYAWSVKRDNVTFPLPNGTTSGQNFEFTPTDNGKYKVTLTVTDSGGQSGSTTTSNITVTNALPNAEMTGVPTGPVSEGTPIVLNVDADDPGAEDVLSYAWTVTKNGSSFALPNGTVANAAGFTFTPTDNGTYVATCVVTDDDGGPTMVASGAITVTNVNPTVAITRTGSGAISEGQTVYYNAVVTDPGSADTHTYQWTATKDGQPYTLAGSTTGAQLAFVPVDQGTYTISVTATDDDTGTGSTTLSSISVVNANPALYVDTVDTAGTEGVAFNLQGAATDPGVNDALTYTWTIVKPGVSQVTVTGITGQSYNGAIATYTPADNGTYYARLTVTDADGGMTQGSTHVIVVANANPFNTSVTVPSTGVEGTAITSSVTTTDVAADTLTYAWSVTRAGNGPAFTLPNGTVTNDTSFTFTPTNNGTYTVSIVVTDEDGGTTGTVSRTVTVTNATPTITLAGDTTGSEGSAVSVTATGNDAGSEDVDAGLTYAWFATRDGQSYTFPTGTNTTSATLAFTPANQGEYVLTAYVTDRDGAFSSTTRTVTVANVAPIATITGTPSTAVNEGSAVNLGATVVDPGTADTLTYSWSVTKNGQPFLTATAPSTTAAFNFTPTDNGSYVATVVVNDGLATDTVSTTAITVNNVNPAGSISGPTTGVEGTSLTLTTTATDAGSADLLGYAWTAKKDGQSFALPNGILTNAATLVYTPADQGEYEFTCVVTDDDNGTVTLTHAVDVSNANPTVTQTGVPSTGVEGTAITIGSTATDVADDTLSYGWTVYRNNQAVSYDSNVTYTGQGLTFTPQDNGSYVVRLSVTDEDGGITTVNSSPIVVANANPVAAITGATTGTEGQAVALSSTVTDAGPADTTAGFTYAWTVKRGNTTVSTGDTASYSFTPSVHGSYTVRLVVTDKDGGTTTTNSTIAVGNVAPSNVAITGMPQNLTEGTAVSLTASAADVSGDTVSYAWQVKRGDSVFASGTGATIAFTAARGPGQVIVTATDTAGAIATRTFDFYAANVAPAASVTGPASNVLIGSSATVSATFADVPSNQAMTVAWDFGDGTTASGDFVGGGVSSKKHTYAAVGSYTVTATINDGVDSTVVTQIVNVSNAAIVSDPMSPTKNALYVVGTDGADNINVSQMDSGKYKVLFNGTSLGTNFDPSGRIYVYGNGGSNTITVTGQTNAVVFAGDAGSNVTTGSGNDVIVGTAGADRLAGNDGRDLIIGAAGPDVLIGGQGEDLIVAAGLKSTDLANLSSIMDKWTNTTNDIAKRRSYLLPLFSTKTLIADAGGNQIYGEAGNDWIVASTTSDRLKDLAKTDLLN